jgi:hypothetical protein
MMLYATVDEFHAYKHIATARVDLSNAQITDIIRDLQTASRRIETYCERLFYPTIATKYFDYLYADRLDFGEEDLLSVTTFHTDNGNTLISSDDYELISGEGRYNTEVKFGLVMMPDSADALSYDDTFVKANVIAGVWGYHEQYSDAYLDSLDALAVDVTDSGTELTVNDADGVSGDGTYPRFQIGQTLKIGDEWMYVSDVNATTDKLTVLRAQGGSTAAAHSTGDKVYIYRPMMPVVRATLITADYLRELPNAPFGTIEVGTATGDYSIPLTIPKTAIELIAPYARVLVGVGSETKRYGYLLRDEDQVLIG